jgi:hypothetical protein
MDQVGGYAKNPGKLTTGEYAENPGKLTTGTVFYLLMDR